MNYVIKEKTILNELGEKKSNYVIKYEIDFFGLFKFYLPVFVYQTSLYAGYDDIVLNFDYSFKDLETAKKYFSYNKIIKEKYSDYNIGLAVNGRFSAGGSVDPFVFYDLNKEHVRFGDLDSLVLKLKKTRTTTKVKYINIEEEKEWN